MALKPCNFCKEKVPEKGQCNSCGFLDGLNRMPTPQEFAEAKQINEDHSYEQFSNLDTLLEKHL